MKMDYTTMKICFAPNNVKINGVGNGRIIMSNKQWKQIPGCNNHEVSSDGKIRNTKTGKVKEGKDRITLYEQGRRKNVYIHKVVDECFGSYVIPDKVQALIDEALEKNLLTQEEISKLFDI